MSDNYKNEYISRICKVQDYIEKEYFNNISVETLANVAGFSKYHFNRIFKSILNESIGQYVNRIRVEHSLFLLAYRTDLSLTDIAYQLGYTDSAIFSRAFKSNYGISPRSYRKKYSTKCKENIYISEYNKPYKSKKKVQKVYSGFGKVRIESRDDMMVVYVSHIGNYRSLKKSFGKLLHHLCNEVEKQQLIDYKSAEILAMYHDNPEFTREDQFRTSLCMSIPNGYVPEENSNLSVMNIEGGLYAIGHFSIHQEQFPDAWDYMYQQWLITSNYFPRDACPFEVYLNNPKEEKDHHIEVEIYMPIEPI